MYIDAEIKAKQKGRKKKNTTKTEEHADRAFQKFLIKCGEKQLDYWNYAESELDNFLCKFWFGAHKNSESDYETESDDPKKKNLMHSANTIHSF